MLLSLMTAGTVPALAADAQTPPSAESPISTVTFETKNGVLNALFLEQTDDAALKAAMPRMIASGVEAITLRNAPVRDASPLAGLTNLKSIDLSGTQVRDLSPLAGLTKLTSLNLQFLRINDLTPLMRLTALRTLNVGGTGVRDLSPLAGLTNLQDLVLTVTKVNDVSALGRLRALTSLNLGGTWVSDVRPLGSLTNLSFLNLNGTTVDDVQPLANMALLRTLDLGGTQVSDIQPLKGLRALRSLNLEGTLVADVMPLTGLPLLETVALGGSHVRDMAPLAHLLDASAGRHRPAEPDQVLIWNDLTNRSIQAVGTDAFEASRDLAIESVVVHDTIKSIDGTPAFMVKLTPPPGISTAVAVAAAAHATLVHLFPSRRSVLDAALASALAREPAGPATTRAVAFGEAVADAVIMLRDGDGAMNEPPQGAGVPTGPGRWRSTPPELLPPAHPQWANIKPFGMLRPEQYRPVGPPAIGSDASRRALEAVRDLGAARSSVRTREQTEIAQYWSDGPGTFSPAGHWNAIAASFVAPLHLGAGVEAELFAVLNVALADAAIAVADAKYTFWGRRPITAIREGAEGIQPDADWFPLLDTPNHPSYVSGHSGFSGAAATVLTAWFGTHPFTYSSFSVPGVTRSFSSFQQAAEEAAISRLYGGIHFPHDNNDGLAVGRAVGDWAMSVFKRVGDDRGPVLMLMDRSMPMANADPKAVVGCALDNLAPVAAVTIRLDGGAPFVVPVNDKGLFTVPPERLGASRRHTAILMATSATGRTSTAHIAFD